MVAREAGGDTEKGSGGGWSEIDGDKDKLLGSHSHLLRLGCLGAVCATCHYVLSYISGSQRLKSGRS